MVHIFLKTPGTHPAGTRVHLLLYNKYRVEKIICCYRAANCLIKPSTRVHRLIPIQYYKAFI